MAAKFHSIDRFARTRLDRRRLIQRAGLGGTSVAVAMALGCSSRQRPPAGGSQQSAGSQPKRGGTLTYAGGDAGSYDTRGASFDPNANLQQGAKSFGLFYERLLAYNLRTFALEPELTQRWEQPSPTEYILHLQPGVKWQNKPPVDGRPLTVDDIRWSLQRASSDDPKFSTPSLVSRIARIEAPDQTTIKLATKSPDASTLTKLSVETLPVLAKEVLDKYPKMTTADSAVGTGAFIMKSAEENVGAEYVRNPDYWRPGLPYLDELRTKAFADTLTSWAAFQANQVDIAAVPGTQVKQYIAQHGPGYKPDWFPDFSLANVFPNTAKPPLTDPRAVRALRLLIDHDEFITGWAEVQYGRGAYGSIFPTAMSAWDLSDSEYRSYLEWKQPKDEAAKEAIALLTAAGFSSTTPLRFPVSATKHAEVNAGTELMVAQWKRGSQGIVDAQIALTDTNTHSQLEHSGTFSFSGTGVSAGMVDPDIWLDAVYSSGGSTNYMRFSDANLDAMIDKQRMIFNETQRKAAVKDIVRYMIDHGPSTTPANRFFLNGTQTRVQGYSPEYFLNGSQYKSIWVS
jgi:peptide/nickel transport system substrate-binding protein